MKQELELPENRWMRHKAEERFKLSQESAESLLHEFLDYYDVGTEANASAEEIKAFEALVDHVVVYYRLGVFENVNDIERGFSLRQHLKNGVDLNYREFAGKDKLAFQTLRGDSAVLTGKLSYHICGVLSGVGETVIAGLKGEDLRAAEAAASLFFIASL
jgi:hypothetical protein